ncbi:hypothetical protein TNCV_3957981 [Trichonephila clavipes]|nr:hypothetical protein TNCV_3957981 [Trichonephila clavipes]
MSTKLCWEVNLGVSRPTEHLIGTSAYAPHRPMSRKLRGAQQALAFVATPVDLTSGAKSSFNEILEIFG